MHDEGGEGSRWPARAREVVRTPRALGECGLLGSVECPVYSLQVDAAPGSALGEHLGGARPHPDAVFVPDRAEWVLHMPATGENAPQDTSAVRTLLAEEGVRAEEHYVTDAVHGPVPFHDMLRHSDLGRDWGVFTSVPGQVPATLPRDVWDAFRTAREQTPAPGMTPRTEVARAVALLVRIFGDALAGTARAIPVQGKAFSQQLRWDETSQAIFTFVGWHTAPLEDGREALQVPAYLHVDAPGDDALGEAEATSETPPDDASRSDAPAEAPAPSEAPSADVLRLIRVYLELAAWCVHFGGTPPVPETGIMLHVAQHSALTPFGSCALPPTPPHDQGLRRAYARLGVPSDATPEATVQGYRVNTAAFPHRLQELFLALEAVHDARPQTEALGVLLAMEKSKGLYTHADVRASYEHLGVAVPILAAPESLPLWDDAPMPASDDAAIIAAYDRRVRDVLDHGTDDGLRDATLALTILSRYHNTPALAARLAQSPVADVAQAYRLIQVSDDIDDGLVVVAYEVYVAETTTRQELLRAALYCIAESRGSSYLRRYLAGDAEEEAGPPFSAPRGLQNIGNTCYLNSVLQYFFRISLLRTTVLEMGRTAQSMDASQPLPTIGGRQADPVVRLLAELFSEMQSSPSAAVTPAKELAYLALVPLAWEQAYRASGEDAPDTLLNHVGTQQDVSECLDNMIFQIQAAMTCYPDATWAAQQGSDVHRLFVGRTAQQLQQATASMHVKEEEFQSIPVTLLPEADSMYDALDTFFDDEELVGEDGKPVRRSVSLVHAPPLLQMQVQRVQYDRARHRAVKNQAGIELEEHLYLDRYMDLAAYPPDEAKRLATVQSAARSDRQEIARLRTRLTHVLGDDQLLPGHMETLEKALTSIPVESYASLPALLGEDKLEALRTTAETLRGEAEQIRTVLHAKRRELQERWADERSVSYRLAAVFMHRGEASHGHYFLDQRDFASDGWISYNDARVNTIPFGEVQRDPTGATSYLVVYVRSDVQEQGLLENARSAS